MRNRLQSIGVRVNETNRLITTAKATVSPKLEKKRPTIPPMKAIGRKMTISDRLVASTASAISRVPLPRRLHAVHAVFFHVPEDVLVYDHRVVDHDADGQDQPQHGDVVEREAHVPHEHEGRDDRGGDGQGGDQGRPPVADEQEDRGRDQHAGQQEVELHFLDRFLDEPRLVADDLGRDVRRQRGLELAEPVLDVLDDLDRVDSRLLLHDQAHGAIAVEPGQRAGLFVRIARRGRRRARGSG